MTTVPADHKEAALGLGATRWEMIRMAVIPCCRCGIIGDAMLVLGRAIGETIAVAIVIGDVPELGKYLFGQGDTLASVIASEFGRGDRPAPLRTVRRGTRAVRAHIAGERAGARLGQCVPPAVTRTPTTGPGGNQEISGGSGDGSMSAHSASSELLQRYCGKPAATTRGPNCTRDCCSQRR